jgi:hypothetical protein
LFIKDDRCIFFLPKSEGAVYRFRFINFYSPFLVPFFKEGEMFLDVEGDSDWVDIIGYYCLIIDKITNKGSSYYWLVGYENIK